MLKIERQQRILALMQETNTVTVRELARLFSSSPITIRRDLLELEEKGYDWITNAIDAEDAESDASQEGESA